MTCKDCDAEIRWAMSKSGKRIMMDFEPSTAGRYVILSNGDARLATDVDRRLLRPLHHCHWDTCPARTKP